MNKNAFHSLGNNLLFGITQALYIDYCLTHIYNQIHSWIYKDNNHGGELRDFRNKNGGYLSKNTFFDISIITCQICMGFEADAPDKLQKHAHLIRLSDKDLV